VCQDFAHLQLSCFRSLGLPARYVSGYLLTKPPEGKEKLVGSDASHAWVAVWCPGHGWVDLDPTNNLIPGEEHITVAWGRDFGDVSPIKGLVVGGGEHKVVVQVDVAPEGEGGG
jgi:transglutaminase-like putative cysteine protease